MQQASIDMGVKFLWNSNVTIILFPKNEPNTTSRVPTTLQRKDETIVVGGGYLQVGGSASAETPSFADNTKPARVYSSSMSDHDGSMNDDNTDKRNMVHADGMPTNNSNIDDLFCCTYLFL
jgi:hypothetical protein